jgi:hypothetical protein
MVAWSAKQVETLTAEWRAGVEVPAIAAALGVSVSAVRTKRHHLGLPARSEAANAVALRLNGQAAATGLRSVRAAHAPLARPRADAWAPLAGSTPRPVEQRMAGECRWPIGAALASCCLPVAKPGAIYCLGHLTISRGGAWPPDGA